jgi:hypothetical protein
VSTCTLYKTSISHILETHRVTTMTQTSKNVDNVLERFGTIVWADIAANKSCYIYRAASTTIPWIMTTEPSVRKKERKFYFIRIAQLEPEGHKTHNYEGVSKTFRTETITK